MNEAIEYAEMLEIPVSTVNVVRKHTRKKRRTEPSPKDVTPTLDGTTAPLKDSLIAQVNDKLSEDEHNPAPILEVDPTLFAESVNSEGRVEFDAVPERIDTVRLYSDEEIDGFFDDRFQNDLPMEEENEGGRYALKRFFSRKNLLDNLLNVEFYASCALCGIIFLTNVFMPNSAVNSFFRAISSSKEPTTDTRTYSDFTLAPVVSALSDAELSLSSTGVLHFTDECCVYPSANGSVADVRKGEDGLYTLKLNYSDSFSGIIHGLNQVYYEVGEEVKCNVPVGYTNGTGEVQVSLYSNGELLNCFTLTEENCLAWLQENE